MSAKRRNSMQGGHRPILVTADRVLASSTGQLSLGDAKLLESTSSESGLIPVTPALLRVLAAAARATVQDLRKTIQLSAYQARLVRRWRVDQVCSWRLIALRWHTLHGGTWTPLDNQLAGMVLCEVAAQILGEDPAGAPWA